MVFAAEGDLWRVPLAGGTATRLTTHPGEERKPALSPDGKWVAFTATYEGPAEVYVMPTDGGEPTRLTFGAGGDVVGWTREGKILYSTGKYSTLPDAQLVVLDPKTRQRTRLPLSQASDGTYDDTGTLYFTRFAFQGSHTKRYEGGTAQNLWKLAPGAAEATPLTADFKGTSRNPLFWQGRIYFLSDRDGIQNIWSMNPKGSDLKQITHETGFDIQNPQLDRGKLVYQHGADLFVADALTGQSRRIPIRLSSDFDQLRERWITKPLEWVTAAHLSPSGDRLVLTARGQVFVVPVGSAGRIIEASRKPGVRYREAHFLPEGKGVVALSDESGEVEIWKLPASGEVTAPREQLTKDGQVLRWDSLASPDGKWLAHTDKFYRLHLLDTATKTNKTIAISPTGNIENLAFSPDSRYLVYSFSGANDFNQLRLYDTKTEKTTPLTTDRYNSFSPTFAPDGKFLYFLSDRAFSSKVSSPWGPRQPEPYFDRQTQVFALALQPGNRSPFTPSDELQKTDEKKTEEKPAEIVTEGIVARLSLVPVPPGNYGGLETDGKKLFLIAEDESGRSSLSTIAIRNEDIKLDTLLRDVSRFELSTDHKKIFVQQGDSYLVFDASGAPDLTKSRVSLLDRWSFSLDPKEEWRQMYEEAWRLHRDYFYDPNMHGVDWKALREKYRPLAARVACRADLSDVLAQLVGELSLLHTYVSGGDQRTGPDNVTVASLGADLVRNPEKGWRIALLWRTDPDIPEKLAPLLQPTVDAHEGDVISQLNGVPTAAIDDLGQLLRAQVGKQVRLTLLPGGDSSKARDVIVTTISQAQERNLRYDDWELSRREAVEKAGAGKLGYLHLRAMGSGDIAQWEREFYPVFNRDGLIIDVRHNGGGNIDSWILEKLLRKAWMFWKAPVGAPYSNMQYAFRGKLVVLCDEWTASDGEAFTEGIKRLNLGKVIGTRTWGGEVWLTSSNTLVDRGVATAAEFGVYGPEGNWLIEGHGVEPDIVVDNLPRATFDGKDTQLDTAIQYLLKEIEKNPNPVPPVPKYPNKAFPKKKG